MNNQSHAFNIEDADAHGVQCAIIMYHFEFWLTKNAANGRNIQDGKVWTYSSVEALAKIFPYWSPSQIRRILQKLEDSGVISTANFNKSAYDRTKWYTLNAFDVSSYSILRNTEFDLTESSNEFGEIVKPIPDTKTDTKTDIETDTARGDEFDDFWEGYHPQRRIKKSACRTVFEKITSEGGYTAYTTDRGSGDCTETHLKATAADIINGAKAYYYTECVRGDTEAKFFASSPAFLNEGRWEDFEDAEELAARLDKIRERL